MQSLGLLVSTEVLSLSAPFWAKLDDQPSYQPPDSFMTCLGRDSFSTVSVVQPSLPPARASLSAEDVTEGSLRRPPDGEDEASVEVLRGRDPGTSPGRGRGEAAFPDPLSRGQGNDQGRRESEGGWRRRPAGARGRGKSPLLAPGENEDDVLGLPSLRFRSKDGLGSVRIGHDHVLEGDMGGIDRDDLPPDKGVQAGPRLVVGDPGDPNGKERELGHGLDRVEIDDVPVLASKSSQHGGGEAGLDPGPRSALPRDAHRLGHDEGGDAGKVSEGLVAIGERSPQWIELHLNTSGTAAHKANPRRLIL